MPSSTYSVLGDCVVAAKCLAECIPLAFECSLNCTKENKRLAGRISEADWLRGLQWDRNGTNMLAGTLSWLAGCALWVTSLAWVRRNYFEACLLPSLALSISQLPALPTEMQAVSLHAAYCFERSPEVKNC